MRYLVYCAFLLISVQPSLAQTQPFGEWVCAGNADELFDITFERGSLRVDNVLMREDEAFSGVTIAVLSASASNRSDKRAEASIEAFATTNNQEHPVFVLSARPNFGFISNGRVEEISARVLTQPGSMASAEEFCVRVNAAAE